MSWKINLGIERMPYHIVLSAEGPVATVKIELKQRCHTQSRDGQGQVTRVEFLRDSNVEFAFSLPLFLLSQSPQLRNPHILGKLLLSSNLDRELCVDLAPQIADFAVNNYTRGSLGWFLIKAEVEVDVEEEEDEMELLRIRERLEEEEDEMELLLRESLDLVRGISLEEGEEDYEIELVRIRDRLEEEEMELLLRQSLDLVRGVSLEEEEEAEDEMELLRIRERLEEEEEEMELLLRESLDFVQKVDMGASISVIEKLKKERKVDSGGEVGTCMVCLEELSSVVELIKMPCDHLFHQSCICRWLEEKNSCPICRCEVT